MTRWHKYGAGVAIRYRNGFFHKIDDFKQVIRTNNGVITICKAFFEQNHYHNVKINVLNAEFCSCYCGTILVPKFRDF